MKNKILPCIIGLGYVGLPIFLRLQKKFKTVGYDINFNRVYQLNSKIDETNSISKNFKLRNNSFFTNKSKYLSECNFFIIAVPTPIYSNNLPNLEYLNKASNILGGYVKKDDIIFFESTVFPGVTKKYCVPILEKKSKLKNNRDFYTGYSPERINPGDKNHTIDKITKIVAFEKNSKKKIISRVYKCISSSLILTNNLEDAETSKVIENIQRDLNIALINEIYKVCDKLKINFRNVIKLAKTKWNFLNFKPGLVGGHCLPVDPYYFSYLAKKNKIQTKVILAGRHVNNSMHKFVINKIINYLNKIQIKRNDSLLFMGLTYKENVPDLRNSLAFKIFLNLKKRYPKSYGYDPLISNLKKDKIVSKVENIKKFKAIILLVNHDCFKKLLIKIKKNRKNNFYYIFQ